MTEQTDTEMFLMDIATRMPVAEDINRLKPWLEAINKNANQCSFLLMVIAVIQAISLWHYW